MAGDEPTLSKPPPDKVSERREKRRIPIEELPEGLRKIAENALKIGTLTKNIQAVAQPASKKDEPGPLNPRPRLSEAGATPRRQLLAPGVPRSRCASSLTTNSSKKMKSFVNHELSSASNASGPSLLS
jgi:hypothetical protein